MNREKISFSSPDFPDSEIVISGLTFLTEFTCCSKNDMYQIVKKNIFSSNSCALPEIQLISNQLEDSTFFN